MKKILLAFAALLFALLPEAAPAQTVTVQPQFISPNAVTDLGNGPMEIKVGVGTAMIGSSVGTGVGGNGGVSGTAITLTATPAIAPCVGCVISGTGITSGTTVAAFNGTTTITLSSAMTVANGTALSWGAACPATALTGIGVMQLSAGSTQGSTDFPFYTQARICGYGQSSAGAQIFTFPIGAH